MRIRTLLVLLSLSHSIYAISQNKPLMDRLLRMAALARAKRSSNGAASGGKNNAGNEEEASLSDEILQQIRRIEDKMERQMESFAKNIFRKMNITDSLDIKKLREEVDDLKRKLQQMEDRFGRNA